MAGDASPGYVPDVRRGLAHSSLRGVQEGATAERESSRSDPVSRRPQEARPRRMRDGSREATIALPHETADHDAVVERDARNVAQVDRAVRRVHRRFIRPVHVAENVADGLGWLLCSCGAGGVRPGAVVMFRGRPWHVECALDEIATASSEARAA